MTNDLSSLELSQEIVVGRFGVDGPSTNRSQFCPTHPLLFRKPLPKKVFPTDSVRLLLLLLLLLLLFLPRRREYRRRTLVINL